MLVVMGVSFVDLIPFWACSLIRSRWISWKQGLTPYPAAMFDLATDQTSIKLVQEFYEAGRIVSAVCHGPAAFINVKLSDGSYLIANSPVTGFSNDEEDSVGLTPAMPFKLEDELNEKSGGKFQKADQPWGDKVVIARDGRLITGQNPASAAHIGQAVYEAIFGDLVSKD